MANTFLFLAAFVIIVQVNCQDYCKIYPDHTMCLYSGPSAACGQIFKRGVTEAERKIILDVHNKYRNNVAIGNETRGNPGPQPSASNMKILVWNTEIANICQRWAEQCQFNHDSCRNTSVLAAMAKEGRRIYITLFKTILNSLKPRKFSGNLVGSDYFGNKYYEIPANPSTGNARTSRWFEPKVKDEFLQELPAEWEAWLRGRRKVPPEESEILKNLAMMQQKKKNALELEVNSRKTINEPVLEKEVKGMESFPAHKEYEIMPGKSQQGN